MYFQLLLITGSSFAWKDCPSSIVKRVVFADSMKGLFFFFFFPEAFGEDTLILYDKIIVRDFTLLFLNK